MTRWRKKKMSGRGKRQFYLTFANARRSFHQALPCEIYPSFSSQSPRGPRSQRSLLLKLPSYQTKYRRDIASQIEW